MQNNIIPRLRQRLAGFFPTAPISVYLVVMTTVITLPLIIFVGYLMLKLEADERGDLQREAMEDARAVSRNIDRRLQEMATSLNLLSQFPELEDGDLAAFHKRVSDSLQKQGLYVIIATADGKQRLNSRVPLDQPLGNVPPAIKLSDVISGRRTVVSNIFYGNTSKEWVFNVMRPLPSALSAAGDALIMTQNARDLMGLISTESLPPGWTIAILDGDNRVVASSTPQTIAAGATFSQTLASDQIRAFSGSFEDDDGTIYAYSQLPGWSWKAIIWGPADNSQSALASTWRKMITGSFALVLIAIAGAYLVGRQMRGSIRELVEMAKRIGEGEIVSPIDTKIKEANQVAIALSNASFDRSQAEDRTHLILHELVHRSKNMLTLVQAMMRQLARENTSVADFQKEVEHRLRGLGMSISALSEVQWQGLPIHKLLETHLKVFGSAIDQVKLAGQDFMLSPEAAQNLGLIIHELATNSIKYGALSAATGTVELFWDREIDGDRDQLTIRWKDVGGPPAVPPTRSGFGTTITKRHAESSFSATISTDYTVHGFRWTLTAPTHHFLARKKTAVPN
ncbi:sensor histidine kinase [Agrobacterium rosae]|uniref:histidine kinase n=1 Tax=Agrobacterium rosae TaxID=1972867 RepID=A0AAE5S0Q7_9HYPH|nr:sensor histidine kinase [Agrobacterium rosae]KAA3512915.1 histidine kinase [Agrobacterium rosae]KAA3521598.1 histidine kinase [Agrobacterium rosae]MCM2432523.1 histidine kinase [Agrobacterium rosae]MDX8328406.1 sensor histidine kinase [Agrobacterium rosae]MQB48523.1 histidine kinase [Agrobacterium rosae]